MYFFFGGGRRSGLWIHRRVAAATFLMMLLEERTMVECGLAGFATVMRTSRSRLASLSCASGAVSCSGSPWWTVSRV